MGKRRGGEGRGWKVEQVRVGVEFHVRSAGGLGGKGEQVREGTRRAGEGRGT